MVPYAALYFLIHQATMTWFIHYFAQAFQQVNTTKMYSVYWVHKIHHLGTFSSASPFVLLIYRCVFIITCIWLSRLHSQKAWCKSLLSSPSHWCADCAPGKATSSHLPDDSVSCPGWEGRKLVLSVDHEEQGKALGQKHNWWCVRTERLRVLTEVYPETH